MAIEDLNQTQRDLLNTLQPLPLKDVAYRLRPDVDSYCVTPYKTCEMYGLNGVTNIDLSDLRRAINDRGVYFYFFDMGNITTIESAVNRLQLTIKPTRLQQGYVRSEYRRCLRYFSDRELFQRGRRISWFGYPVIESDRAAGYDYVTNIKRVYPNLEQANRFFDEFENQLDINPETDVPKPRMEFTSRATGVFTFARCAPTLYAFPCFKIRRGQKDCVDPMNVREVGKRYYLVDAPDVRVKKYGLQLAEDDSSPYKTLAKKVYAVRNNKLKITPYINIYVNVTASYDVDADDYVYNSFAAIALARVLTTAGFRVSITTLYVIRGRAPIGMHEYPYDTNDEMSVIAPVGSGDERTDYIFLGRFATKSYNELLDYNLALIYGGDPAFFRYDMFKMSLIGTYAWHRAMSESYGSPVVDEARIEQILDDYNVVNLENETRVVIAGRFSRMAASDCVRSKLAELNILYGGR